MRVLSIIFGFFMMLVGIFCVANSGIIFMGLAFIVGVVLMLSGLVGACAYMFGKGETKYEASWFLSESIIALILGAVVLANLITSDASVPYVFGMFALTSGVLRLVLSVTKRDQMVKEEKIAIFVMGVIGTLFGCLCFLSTAYFGIVSAVIVGVTLLIYGGNLLVYGILMKIPSPHGETYGI